MPELPIEELPDLLGPFAQTILEIGANDGEDTLRFVEALPDAHVYCFECDPRAIAKWHANVGNRATLVEMALSDECGEFDFYQSGGTPPNCQREDWQDWDKSGSLCLPTGHLSYSPWCKFDSTIQVPTTTLDEWADNTFDLPIPVDLAWIDVQGAEAKVLRGGQRVLARTRYVYVECHNQQSFGQLYLGYPTLDELIALLPGHDLIGEYSENYLFRRKGEA
jgi:FkbM family methyltransferase